MLVELYRLIHHLLYASLCELFGWLHDVLHPYPFDRLITDSACLCDKIFQLFC